MRVEAMSIRVRPRLHAIAAGAVAAVRDASG